MINKLVPQLIDQDVLLYLQIQTDFQSKLYNVDTKRYRAKCINPFTPGDFAEKRILELVKQFSGHRHSVVLLRAKTYHKASYRSCTSRPSDPDAKYQLAKFGHAQKAKFRFKSDTGVFTFTFSLFLSSPLFSLFLPHFFSLTGHLVGFILVAKVFRKAFRILGSGERKGRWVVQQDFHGNFQVNVT